MQRDAGVVDQDVDAAEVGCDLGDDAVDVVLAADIELPAPRDATGAGDLGDHRIDRADVEHCDLGAFIGEQMCGRTAHAAGSAGDDGDFASDGTRKFAQSGHEDS